MDTAQQTLARLDGLPEHHVRGVLASLVTHLFSSEKAYREDEGGVPDDAGMVAYYNGRHTQASCSLQWLRDSLDVRNLDDAREVAGIVAEMIDANTIVPIESIGALRG